jgi:glutamate 5-kinase
MGVVPIVNENDTISVSVRPISLHSRSLDSVCLVSLTKSRNVQEIKFGDNDTLSAITSSMVHADYLFLLTDVDGLYLSNPRKDPDAKFLEVVSSVAEARLEGREPANSSLHHLASFIYLFPVFIPPNALRPTFHPLLPLSPSLLRTQKERN